MKQTSDRVLRTGSDFLATIGTHKMHFGRVKMDFQGVDKMLAPSQVHAGIKANGRRTVYNIEK